MSGAYLVEDGVSDEKERVRLADVGLPNSDIFLLKPGVGGLLEVLLDPWPGGVGLSSGLLEFGVIGGVISLFGAPSAACVIDRRVLREGCDDDVPNPDIC